jgi:hypothetical protein
MLPGLTCAAAILVAPAARADVSSPGERIVPSEAVIEGLADFPALRFVVAVVPVRSDMWMPEHADLPAPSAVRDGVPVATSTRYFQELRAIPRDAPEPVTDAWLASSHAPSSGSFTRHPLRVPVTSGERTARSRFRVRQIEAGWIALELISVVAMMGDGSERPIARGIPRSYEIESVEAPPGWRLFLMPDPSWPRTAPAPPIIACGAGDLLPLSPGPRTLVAVEGSPGPDGSLAGKPHVVWGRHLDAFQREEVPAGSPVIAHRAQLAVQIDPGHPLRIAAGDRYQDARGLWFHDEEATFPVDVPRSRWVAGVAGAGALLVVGAWVARRARRRRRRSGT